MKVTDLFSGCGGFSLGFKELGFDLTQAIEIDESACDTFSTNLGLDPLAVDIRSVTRRDIKSCDVLVGGFPCQPFSLSGLQAGFADKGGYGFQECLRVIDSADPKIVILENVTGFAKLHTGIFLKVAIHELRKRGYTVRTDIIDASDYGVAQTRSRLFIFASKVGNGLPRVPPPDSQSKCSVYTAIEDLVGLENQVINHEPMKHTARIVERFKGTRQGESTREAMDRDSSLGSAKITKQCYRRLVPDLPAPTVVANFVTTTIHYSQHRNITAREGARIQSFPDEFVFKGLKTRMSWQEGLSQFEQIGNAVPPRIAQLYASLCIQILSGESYQFDTQLEQQDFLNDVYGDLERTLKTIVSKKAGKRGRTSKHQKLYSEMESGAVGSTFQIPAELIQTEFFLKRAMSRRSITYEIVEKDGVHFAKLLSKPV